MKKGPWTLCFVFSLKSTKWLYGDQKELTGAILLISLKKTKSQERAERDIRITSVWDHKVPRTFNFHTHTPFSARDAWECHLLTVALIRVDESVHTQDTDVQDCQQKKSCHSIPLPGHTMNCGISFIATLLCSSLVQLGVTYFAPSLQGSA